MEFKSLTPSLYLYMINIINHCLTLKMKFILAIIINILFIVSNINNIFIDAKHCPDLIKTFEQFKEIFNKHYESIEAENVARINFEKSLRYVEANQDMASINHFADLSNEEFRNKYLIKYDDFVMDANMPKYVDPKNLTHCNEFLPKNFPKEFDLRKLKTLSKIYQQGGCSSCWAFAALAAVESAYLASGQNITELSIQELIDCQTENDGCNGGYIFLALDYVLKHGVLTDKSYPYERITQKCELPKIGKRYHIKNWCLIYNGNHTEEIKQALVNYRTAIPVQIIIKNSQPFFLYNGKSILREDLGQELNVHEVNIVGWGLDNNGIEYWIMRNSWGTGWGDNGYGYIEMNKNLFGIESFPHVVTI
ncbi:peptidase 1-like [Dermatophagoides pteronyssinus]|uniref:peptidase 1-like n=1 Tax=Dermatophagoides pteronyssinus TaxID=6956 RepID=UPI003F66E77D